WSVVRHDRGACQEVAGATECTTRGSSSRSRQGDRSHRRIVGGEETPVQAARGGAGDARATPGRESDGVDAGPQETADVRSHAGEDACGGEEAMGGEEV